MKKNGDEQYNMTMGTFDPAKLYELVGLHLLSKLNNCLNVCVGLYHGGGLAAVHSRRRRLDQLRKEIIQGRKSLHHYHHQPSVEDFLDIMFELGNNKYSP